MSETSPAAPSSGKPPSSTPQIHAPVTPAPAAVPTPQSIASSPFFQMFERAGMVLNAKQFTQIINNLLRTVIDQIKKSDESWKRAMDELKKSMKDDS